LIRGFRLITKTLHRINILFYIRQPSRIIRASRFPNADADPKNIAAISIKVAGHGNKVWKKTRIQWSAVRKMR
jgi:hypothetical protein